MRRLNLPWLITNAMGLFVLLYIMGAFEPVLGSPLVKKLDQHMTETAPVLRGICRGVWQAHPQDVQNRECGK